MDEDIGRPVPGPVPMGPQGESLDPHSPVRHLLQEHVRPGESPQGFPSAHPCIVGNQEHEDGGHIVTGGGVSGVLEGPARGQRERAPHTKPHVMALE